MYNKTLNRILSLMLIGFMLTPVFSYATGDTDATEETTDENTTQDSEEQQENIDSGIVFEDLAKRRQSEAVVATKQDSINGHEFVTENDKFELYLDKEAVSILIRCKENGAIVESVADSDEAAYQNQIGRLSSEWEQFVESGISIQTLKKTAQTRFGSVSGVTQRQGSKRAEKKIEKIADGFKATISYPAIKIEFTIYVHLTDSGIVYEIPKDEVIEGQDVEEKDTEGKDVVVQYYISNLYVFPFLGATMLDIRDGYMFLPDGNGITVDFVDNHKKFTDPYISRVYGNILDDLGMDNAVNESLLTVNHHQINTSSEAEKYTIPVYGMVHEDSQVAIMTVLEDGEESAKVYGSPNGANSLYWNLAYVCYTLRTQYAEKVDSSANAATNGTMNKERLTGDIKTSVILLTGEDADYTGMALAYRDKLLAEGVLDKDKNDSSYKIRLQFLGTDKEDFLVFKRSVTTTTFEQALEILNDLKDNGVTDTFVVYDGWQKGGMYALPIKTFKVDKAVGSKSELKKFVETVEKDGNSIVLLSDNLLDANPDTGNITFNTIKRVNRLVYNRKIYGNVYDMMYALIPEKSIEYLKDVSSGMKKNGVNSISVTGITDQLFTHLKDNVTYTRTDVAKVYHDGLADVSKDMYVALETPFSYLWDTMNAYTNTPVGTSDYIFASDEVAFLTTVLKGCVPMYSDYVNFEANKTQFFLKLVETGVYPSFYLTYESPSVLQNTNSDKIYSSQYDTYKEEIIEYYNELKEVNDKIGNSLVSDHTISGDITVTSYENGVKVYVNYGKTKTSVDGLMLDGESYLVVE